MFNDLTDKALKLISNAHIIHDELEAYYIKALNFDILNDIYLSTINKLSRYI